jgi:hypothetical protein
MHLDSSEARIELQGALLVLLPPPTPHPSLFAPKMVGGGGSMGFAAVGGAPAPRPGVGDAAASRHKLYLDA